MSTIRGHEQASALTFAIIVSVLGLVIVSAMTTMLDFSGKREQNTTSRSANVAVVDRALASYEFALESALTSEFHGFRLDTNMLTRLAAENGSQFVPNGTLAGRFGGGMDRTWMPAQYAFAVSTPAPSGATKGWWQLVNVIPPGPESGNVVAYIRTWVTDIGETRLVGEPRLVRAELRPGRFSDYQVLVDGPLVLGGGTVIQGRVHTNGYPDAYLVDAFTNPGMPLKLGNSSGSPTCTGGAAFSTASGEIDGTCGSANLDENTGRLIDLLRGKSHLQMMKRLCGSIVSCPGGGGPWTITLNGGSARFSSATGGTTTVPITQSSAVYIEGEATITGQVGGAGRLTIGIASLPTRTSAFGSASLSLLGSGVIGAQPGSDAIVGLIVEGDVIPRTDLGHCPTGLRAAVVSASGSLTMPPQYRVPSLAGTPPAPCASFQLFGSLGTHYAPLLYLDWGTARTGYTNRDYRYDVRLRTTPPPLFPLTGPWQVTSWKDATPECLAAARREDPTCG